MASEEWFSSIQGISKRVSEFESAYTLAPNGVAEKRTKSEQRTSERPFDKGEDAPCYSKTRTHTHKHKHTNTYIHTCGAQRAGKIEGGVRGSKHRVYPLLQDFDSLTILSRELGPFRIPPPRPHLPLPLLSLLSSSSTGLLPRVRFPSTVRTDKAGCGYTIIDEPGRNE